MPVRVVFAALSVLSPWLFLVYVFSLPSLALSLSLRALRFWLGAALFGYTVLSPFVWVRSALVALLGLSIVDSRFGPLVAFLLGESLWLLLSAALLWLSPLFCVAPPVVLLLARESQLCSFVLSSRLRVVIFTVSWLFTLAVVYGSSFCICLRLAAFTLCFVYCSIFL